MKFQLKKGINNVLPISMAYTRKRRIDKFCKKILKNRDDFNLFFRTLDNFEKDLLNASLVNLFNTRNKLHINNFAYSVRELITIYLNRRAPEKRIKDTVWFNEEKVSRTHQVKYLIQKNIDDEYFDPKETNLLQEIRECGSNFNKLYNKLNKFTHINKKTFNYNSTEGYDYIKELFDAIFNFFTMLENLENELQNFLADYIDGHLHEEIAHGAIDAIDECSTHHLIEDTQIYSIVVNEIDEEYIYFNGEGEISVEQQYGSNSDLRRGDGMTTSTTFPVSFSGRVEVSDFTLVEIDSNLEVNNDGHYGITRDKKFYRKLKLQRLYWSSYHFLKDIPYKFKRTFIKKKFDNDDLDF